MNQPIAISRTFLTLLIVFAILVPVSCGMILAFRMSPVKEPLLDAKIRFETTLLESSAGAMRKVSSLRVRNDSDSAWKNLSVGLNKNIRLNQTQGMDSQFYANEPAGLKPGQEIAIPLEAFVARNGSVPFPAGTREVTHVTVLAQIPSGARAVAEFPITSTNKDRADDIQSWLTPTPKIDKK